MKVTRQSRRNIRLQNIGFVVLFLTVIGLLAWLSTQYRFQADLTANQRNTLSPASVELLRTLTAPVRITSFARETPMLRKAIDELVGRYQRYKADIELVFVNPDVEPQQVRARNITVEGELVIEYQGRNEQLQEFTEQGITNALQRLARGQRHRLLVLSGHGERSVEGDASYDLSALHRQLTGKGIDMETFNLAEHGEIPADTSALILSNPQVALLPGEVEKVVAYVRHGGNLLWLADPDEYQDIAPLSELLGIGFQPGIVIDPNVAEVGMMLFGSNDPRLALIARYPEHAITRDFDFNTLFPIAGGITRVSQDEWQGVPLLRTLGNTWAESGATTGQVRYDAKQDIGGPLTIGVALSREIAATDTADEEAEKPARQQRVLVVADGDFLSNGFLGIGGNLQLAVNMTNWLTSDDRLIAIPARITPDASLALSNTALYWISGGFLVMLPLGLVGAGFVIWYRRRRA